MNRTKKLIYAAMCLALCFVLPFLTGQIPSIGNMLCPMHLPVLLCGFICGPIYGLVVGLAAPLLRSLALGMPPFFPHALAMAFELCAYGFFAGWLYKLLPKKVPYIYVSLLGAMIIGRLVWGAVRLIIFGLGGAEFAMAAFISGAFTTAVPGIILQLLLIPMVVMAMEKSKLMRR